MSWDAFPEMEGIIKDFVAEAVEGLDRLDLELISLENAPHNEALLGSVLRTVHSIKGTSGVLGFLRIERLLHVAEDVLIAIRANELSLSNEITSAILQAGDLTRELLAGIEAEGKEPEVEVQPLAQVLGAFLPVASVTPSAPLSLAETTELVEAPSREVELEPAPLPGAERTVRIDVEVLDRLMDQVGELVLARNRIQQLTAGHKDAHLFAASQRLGAITSDLQEGVMKTRMQPITTLWNRLPRQVRDLASSFGKEVRLVTSGEDTELDRTVLEAFSDPLTHLVRNCIDHGLERPEVRRAAGKPPAGTLRLSSFHQGGYVYIEVADDGGGLHVDKILRRALSAGLISEEAARDLPERKLHQLIFRPGFSTADEVTAVSGRGVGLDVVKTNVERIGGSIDVESRLGQGTTFQVRIPLTLAIIPALMISCAGERFAIPQVSLLELLTLSPDDELLEEIQGAPVYRLREELLSLVDLRSVLGEERVPLRSRGEINVVVLQTNEEPFGLIVDAIEDTEEIVVKPLGDLLQGLEAYSGATVLGDGHVALILDVNGIATLCSVSQARASTVAIEAGSGEGVEEQAGETEALLLVRSSDDGRLAIPLSSVARLEEFEGADVERAGAVPMIQYRGTIIPLIYVSQLLDGSGAGVGLPERPTLQAVVYQGRGFSAGLVVDEILDIVDARLEVAGPSTREGVLRTAVVQDRVTEILDEEWLLKTGSHAVEGRGGSEVGR